MAAPAGTNRRAAVRESGPRVRPIIAKGDTDGRKACPKRRMGRAGGRGQAAQGAGGGRGEVEGARAQAGSSAGRGQACRSSDRATRAGLSRARAGSAGRGRARAPPYSMPTTVARSGTVTRARAVVMNVPWAIVFASPWYW